MTESFELPLFPLSTVLFPAGLLPLRVFEPRYVAMTRQCMRQAMPFGVTLIRAGFEVGLPAIPHEIGCTARILECLETAPDNFALVAQGESVFRVLEQRIEDNGLIVAQVEVREPPDPTPMPERHALLGDMLARAIARFGIDALPQPHRAEDAAWVGYRLAEMLPMTPERRQQLLELDDPLAVLDRVAAFVKDAGGLGQ